MILSLIPKFALGGFVGGVIGAIVTGDWIYSIVWSVSLTVFLLVALTLGARRRRGFPAGEGLSLARVETIQRTGLESAGVQQCDARLTVVPADDAPYQTTARIPIATEALREHSPGTVIVVRRLRSSSPDVVVVPDPGPEWAALVARARADASLLPVASAVPAWETATTTTPGTARPRTHGSRAGVVISLSIAAVVAALVLIPAYGSIARAAVSIATGDWDGTSLTSGVYQQDAVDQLVAAVGAPEFTAIYFYDTYLTAEAPTRPGAATTDSYTYRYGRAWREGPASIQPTDLATELFDASAIDFTTVGVAVRDARARTDLVGDLFVLAYVARPPLPSDGTDTAAPIIHVGLSGDYGSEFYRYTVEGEFVERG